MVFGVILLGMERSVRCHDIARAVMWAVNGKWKRSKLSRSRHATTAEVVEWLAVSGVERSETETGVERGQTVDGAGRQRYGWTGSGARPGSAREGVDIGRCAGQEDYVLSRPMVGIEEPKDVELAWRSASHVKDERENTRHISRCITCSSCLFAHMLLGSVFAWNSQ